MTTTKFGLIRHSETEWNRKKILQGQLDSPLTDFGVQRVGAWGLLLAPLGWDLMVSSDLGRAAATARLVNQSLNIPQEQDPRLREQDWGEWTGMAWEDLKAGHRDELVRMDMAGWDGGPPGGETRRQVLARAQAAIEDLAQTRPGKKILLVAHEGVIKYLVYKLWRDENPDSPTPKLFSHGLHLITWDDANGLRLDNFNAVMLP